VSALTVRRIVVAGAAVLAEIEIDVSGLPGYVLGVIIFGVVIAAMAAHALRGMREAGRLRQRRDGWPRLSEWCQGQGWSLDAWGRRDYFSQEFPEALPPSAWLLRSAGVELPATGFTSVFTRPSPAVSGTVAGSRATAVVVAWHFLTTGHLWLDGEEVPTSGTFEVIVVWLPVNRGRTIPHAPTLEDGSRAVWIERCAVEGTCLMAVLRGVDLVLHPERLTSALDEVARIMAGLGIPAGEAPDSAT
jgi:hypothetical protein